MKAASALLVAVLVVLLIVVVVAVARDANWAEEEKDDGETRAAKLYRASDGSFDAAARAAVRAAIVETPNPTPADRLLAANVITNTVLNREAPAARDVTAGRARARQRLDLYGVARRQLITALDDAAAGAGGGADAIIVDAAAGFAHGALAALFANDPLLGDVVFFGGGPGHVLGGGPDMMHGWPLQDGILVDFDMDGAARWLDAPVAARAGALREQLVDTRRREARAVAGPARGAVADTYVALATAHVDDPQNVHDHSVLSCLRGIVERLRADQGPVESLPPVDAVIGEIRAAGDTLSRATPHTPPRPQRVADAVAVAERTKAGERVVAVGATDEECLRRVWARASDPRNAANRGAIRAAVFDALVDSWEGTPRHIMCVNGRTGHILGALAMLDHDNRNWIVERLEHFKNSIFARTRDVIEREAAAAAASPDAELAKAGRLYLAKTAAEAAAAGDPADEAVDRLAATMRAAIAAMVDEYAGAIDGNLGTEGTIPPYMVESIKKEAQAAVS
jgi:hypothetical protein